MGKGPRCVATLRRKISFLWRPEGCQILPYHCQRGHTLKAGSSGGCSTKRLKQSRSYSQKEGLSKSMKPHSRGIKEMRKCSCDDGCPFTSRWRADGTGGQTSVDDTTQQVQNSFTLRNFYNQMDVNPEQCLAITKAILLLTGSTRDSNLAERKAKKGRKFEDTSLTFFFLKRYARSIWPPQSTLVYNELHQRRWIKRATVDTGSSINIISLPVLKTTRVSRDKIVKQPIMVAGFAGIVSFTLDHINLDLTIGPMRTILNSMYWQSLLVLPCPVGEILDSPTQVVLSTYHKCIKIFWKGKNIHIWATDSAFQ